MHHFAIVDKCFLETQNGHKQWIDETKSLPVAVPIAHVQVQIEPRGNPEKKSLHVVAVHISPGTTWCLKYK